MLVTLLLIIVVFLIVGTVMYVVETQVQMPAGYKTVLRIVVLVLLLIWVLYRTGLLSMLERA